ncbi:4800_t:CDS:2 [Ambispora leptoticha]|uniref:4800_t:CDS:1 n=1 Tax=Ambispora leptoticha TaxID=144679 RepID=A0A9N8WSM7_9GLOM|nr:4800_t:CDS:2 [Ambispora leptoticha]
MLRFEECKRVLIVKNAELSLNYSIIVIRVLVVFSKQNLISGPVAMSAKIPGQYIEWIPYDLLTNIELLAEGGFGIVYRAEWLDGRIPYEKSWNYEQNTWNRPSEPTAVALKVLKNYESSRVLK